MTTTSTQRRGRVRAPELTGRGWLNTGGVTLRLGDLRGRFVLLDFWTFCCINCLHVLDEMRPLESEFPDELVVVGVHSPKFEHEADPDALRAAVERYAVEHPVLDDPTLSTWQAYTAQAWPTLVLVDPEGYVIAHYAGEGHVHAIAATLRERIPVYLGRGTLQPGDSPYRPPAATDGDLLFPAKAITLPDGHLLVADAGHHSLVELESDADAVVRRIGSGTRRLHDGPASEAAFNEPNGLCLLPAEVAARVGYDVVVADTVNHAVRGVSLATGEVATVAGDGRQWMQGDGTSSLSSPWDVAWWRDRVWIAMAGIHQLWSLDPLTGDVRVEAGTTHEGLVDGTPAEAWFAQPSGLAADGDRLWIADAEVSALRWLDDDGVHTAIGEGLFDFGFRDGSKEQARMQHPLGVAVLRDGSVAVADTYNGAVRRYDPATGLLGTVASGLAEVSGLVVNDGRLLAVVSAEHRLVETALGTATATGSTTTTTRAPTAVSASVTLDVDFTPPPGQKLDDRFGSPVQLQVDSTPPSLVASGGGVTRELTRHIQLDPAVGSGVLHVSARAASCDIEDGEGAACHMHQQDWGIPVLLDPDGSGTLSLALGGAVSG